MQARRLFVAGSTGAVGKVFVAQARARGVEVIAHQRPKPGRASADQGTAVFELSEEQKLREAVSKCTTVVQLIGTIRARFGQGDTYASSDVGTTRQLVDAAKGTSVDHFILLSSVGAGRPIGAYLKAKAEAEALVRDSGIPYTIFRPSAFMGDRHRAFPGAKPILRALGLRTLEPIALEDLAAALLRCALERAPLNTVVEGRGLWELVEGSQASGGAAR